MSNFHLKDRRLSYKAKGLLSEMLSLPPDWNYSLPGLAAIAADGIDAVRTAINELEKYGYVRRPRQLRDENGRMAASEYLVGVRKSESRSRSENQGLVTINGAPWHTQKTARELGAEFTISAKNGVLLNSLSENNKRLVESSYRKVSVTVNPIIEWSESDVWEFLHYHGCESNPLYKKGFQRIGCVGCPLNSKNQRREFELYPKYREIYTALKAKDLKATKAWFERKYGQVRYDEQGEYIRVYDFTPPEEISAYLYENDVVVSEIKTDKISLEEYYIDLMNGGK